MSVSPPLTKDQSTSILPLAVFHYGPLLEKTDSVVLSVKPQYFVINTSQGLWAKIGGHQSDISHNISKYKTAGIRVIGYITAGYEGLKAAVILILEEYTELLRQYHSSPGR